MFLSSGLWEGASPGAGDLGTHPSYPMYVQATSLLDCLLFPGLREEAAPFHPQAIRAQPLGLPVPGAILSPNA